MDQEDGSGNGPTTRTEAGPRAAAASREHLMANILERYGLLVLSVVVAVVFTVLRPDTFGTYANWTGIATSGSVLAVVAIALMIPLVAGRFDISVGANVGLSAIIAASVMSSYHLPLALAVLAGILTGAAVGAVNGLLVAYLGVHSIIGTLGVSIIIGGLVSAYTGGTPISSGLSPLLTDLNARAVAGVPVLFVFTLVVAAIAWFVLRQTPYGRYLQGVGSNLRAARLTGIPVNRIVLLSFVTGGATAGVAGVLQIAAQGNADPSVGTITFVLPALAAAFLGATTWRPGTYNVGGTVISLYFLTMVVSGLSLLGAAPWVTDVFNGTALILAIVLSAYLRRRRTGSSEVGE
ncbi:ABC transporter permease [Streptomyces sp. NPDC047000]|uniref:ABC transporter permease n=1 Tax=Streptomyces sp. NPDC047000 TaxID=3155474 RepID=UPI0033C45F96